MLPLGLDMERPDNRFIPVRAEDLARVLASDIQTFGPHAERLLSVANAITEVIDQEVNAFERQVAHAYSTFNPNRDTISLDENPSSAADVLRMFGNLLEQANFERLTEEQVMAAVKMANTHGIKVKLDPDQVSDLLVWVRGQGLSLRKKRTLRAPIKGAMVDTPIYRRLAVVTRLKGEPHIHLKLFKDIPIPDVEALLPNASVRMGFRDLATVFVTANTAIVTVIFNIVTSGLAALGQLASILAMPLLGVSWRTFSSYRRALKDRNFLRTKNLYFQNLGNNASAVHMLSAMIAQEEVKEALLIYAFCGDALHAEAAQPTTDDELTERIAAYLRDRFHVIVDFDMPDAMETMDRLGLWRDRAALHVVPPDQAVATLEAHWRQRLTIGYHAGLAHAVGGTPTAEA